jgi:hypothetical protein
MEVNMIKKLLGAAIIGALGFGALAVIPANATVTTGKTLYPQYEKWVGYHGKYVVRDDTFGAQTVLTNDGGQAFTIKSGGGAGYWSAYPNIFVGCQYSICSGDNPLPIQVKDINYAMTDFDTVQKWTGSYNAAYDIWFDAHGDPDSGTNANTELMIWISHPGISMSISGNYWIDGRDYGIAQWWHKPTPKSPGTWRYIAFVAYTQHQYVNNANLVNFFQAAENAGALSRNSYLTSVDAGFELRWGAAGNRVHYFSLDIARR